MAGLLLLLFLIVPIVELYVIIQVGSWLGVVPTLALLVLVSVLGAWLVKREGLGMWARVRSQLERGALPANELIDGFLILLAGALMLTPGFVTDIVGILLLIPATRSLARLVFARRFKARLERATVGYGGSGGSFGYRAVYDVQDVGDVTPPEWRERPDGNRRRELGES
jgi:UPF0716 protein FxsA